MKLNFSLSRLVWYLLIPHILLLGIQMWDASLIWPDLNPHHQSRWMVLFAMYGVVVSLDIALVWVWHHKKYIPLPLAIASFASILISSIVIIMNGGYVPFDIPRWMYDESGTYLYHFTFMMPALVIWLHQFGADRIKLGDTNWKLPLGLLIGIPLSCYILIHIGRSAHQGVFGIIVGLLMISAPIVLIYALIKLLLLMVNYCEKHSLSQWWIIILVGVALPAVSLWFNSEMKWPADFNNPWVYTWLAINTLLMLPLKSERYQFFSYPFSMISFSISTYFLLVYIPYLPLAMIAIVFAGFGFVMLCPILLWVVHNHQLDLRHSLWVNRIGAKQTLILSIGCFLVLPLGYTVHCLHMRHSLTRALDHVFTPWSPEKQTLDVNDAQQAAKALVYMRDMKAGVNYPYLHLMHRSIVLGNMVLGNTKMQYAYKVLTGESMPTANTKGRMDFNFRGGRGGRVVKPFRGIELSAPKQIGEVNLGSHTLETTWQGNIHNPTKESHAEFVADLTVPKGALISNVALKIHGQWKDATIRDKKTAIWVYDKIKEVRRDPILVYYETQNNVKVKVYPIFGNQTRSFRITFRYPAGFKGTAFLNHHALSLGNDDKDIWLQGQQVSFASAKALAQGDPITRKPYLHILMDYPHWESHNNQTLTTMIRDIAQEAGVSDGKVSIAGLNTLPLTRDLVNLSTFNLPPKDLVKAHPGGSLDLAMQSTLHANGLAGLDQPHESRAPILVCLTKQTPSTRYAKKAEPTFMTPVNPWQALCPDVPGYYRYNKAARGIGLLPYTFTGDRIRSKIGVRPSFAVQLGEHFTLVPEGDPLISLHSKSPKLFRNGQWQDQTTMDIAAPMDAAYGLWLQSFQPWVKRPTMRDRLLTARKLNILVQDTAFIAVETKSQENLLKRKEAQKLKQHDALDFEEIEASSPELILLILVVLICLRRRWREKLMRLAYRRKPYQPAR